MGRDAAESDRHKVGPKHQPKGVGPFRNGKRMDSASFIICEPGEGGYEALDRLWTTVLAAHARSRGLGVVMQKGGLRPGTPQAVTAHSVCAQPVRGYSKLIAFVQQRAQQPFSSWAAEEQDDGKLEPRPDLDTDAGERQRSSPGPRGC